MEESKRTEKRDDTGNERPDRVIDLTSDMALPSDNGGRIIDLTNVLHAPPEADDPSTTPAVEATDAAVEAEPATNAPSSTMEMDTSLPPEEAITALDDAADETAAPPSFTQDPLPDPDQGWTPATAIEEDPPALEASASTPVADDDDPTAATDAPPPPQSAAPAEAPAPPLVQQPPDVEIIDLGDVDPVETYGSSPVDDPADAEIIELTDIVSAEELARIAAAAPLADDEEIIDLTDVVPPEELERIMQDLSLAEEEETIQLTDIVSPEELARIAEEAAQEQDTDEPAIELTDIVPSVETASGLDTDVDDAPLTEGMETDPATEMSPETEADATTAASDLEAPVADTPTAAPMAEEESVVMAPEQGQPDDWIVAELDETPMAEPEDATEAVDDTHMPEPPAAAEALGEAPALDPGQRQPGDWIDDDATEGEERVIRLDTVLDRMRRHEQRLSDDIAQGIETELQRQGWAAGEAGEETETAAQEGAAAAQTPTDLNDAALERAIERVIRTQYGQTIEKTIATVVEQVVNREMARIRQELLEEEPPQG